MASASFTSALHCFSSIYSCFSSEFKKLLIRRSGVDLQIISWIINETIQEMGIDNFWAIGFYFFCLTICLQK